jgi:hypothetical protein
MENSNKTSNPDVALVVKKEDGKVYAFNMPDKFAFESGGDPPYSIPYLNPEYYDAVKQALSSAVLCSDQEQAVSLIAHGQTILDIEKAKKYYCKPDHPYVIPGLTFEIINSRFAKDDIEVGSPAALLSLTEIKEEKTEKQEIKVFELDMHDSKIIDTLKSNILGMIETELEELENGAYDVLHIEIRRKGMSQDEYENMPEFEGY